MSSSDTIALDVPLRAEYATHLRLLVASIASDLGFTVDELDDLRLAVSETFTILLDGVGRDDEARGTLELTIDEAGIGILVARVGASETPDIDALATSILTSVVDDFSVVPGGISMSKRAVEAAASP